MIPSILIDKTLTPGGKELRLYQHDRDFSIRIGTHELMNSRAHASEDSLAQLALERMERQTKPRILIGGLGMGFTLRAALDRLPPDAEVVVAEYEPAVVKWNRGILAPLAGNPLADKRVTVHEADVAKIIRDARPRFAAILLDVDNGPKSLAGTDNNWLYGYKGLYAARVALKTGGVLAVWSAGPDAAFSRRLRAVNFDVKEVRVRARPGKGAHHLIWLAKVREEETAPDTRARRTKREDFRR